MNLISLLFVLVFNLQHYIILDYLCTKCDRYALLAIVTITYVEINL